MAIWRLDDGVAELEADGFRGRVVLGSAEPGLECRLGATGGASDTRLFCVRLPAALGETSALPADAYVRGNDLVATYASPSEEPVRVQVYWTYRQELVKDVRVAGIEMHVSIQTSQLDFDPTMLVSSQLPPCEVLAVTLEGATAPWEANDAERLPCVLARGSDADVSYLEASAPDDDSVTGVEDDRGGSRIVHRLFGDSLEKGVILRARLRGVVVSRADDSAIARPICEAFAQAAPRLTT